MKCHGSHKTIFTTKIKADNFIKTMTTDKTFRSYQCTACGMYHITSMSVEDFVQTLDTKPLKLKYRNQFKKYMK